MASNTWQVSTASSNDANGYDDPCPLESFTLTGTKIWLGWLYHGGFRFTGVNIPQGATIVTAKLQCHAFDNRAGAIDSLNIYGEDADDPSTFSDSADWCARTRTSASVPWSPDDWTSGNWYDSPEIKTIIQEIVNRPAYAGDALVIMVQHEGSSNNTRTVTAYDGTPANAAKLYVEWQVSSTTTTTTSTTTTTTSTTTSTTSTTTTSTTTTTTTSTTTTSTTTSTTTTSTTSTSTTSTSTTTTSTTTTFTTSTTTSTTSTTTSTTSTTTTTTTLTTTTTTTTLTTTSATTTTATTTTATTTTVTTTTATTTTATTTTGPAPTEVGAMPAGTVPRPTFPIYLLVLTRDYLQKKISNG